MTNPELLTETPSPLASVLRRSHQISMIILPDKREVPPDVLDCIQFTAEAAQECTIEDANAITASAQLYAIFGLYAFLANNALSGDNQNVA